MNVCLVSTGFYPEDGGGIGTYVYNLAQGLTDLGHKVFVITQTQNKDKEELIGNISVLRIRWKYLKGFENFFPGLIWSIFVAGKIRMLDKKFGIDVVEFPNWEGVGFWFSLTKRRKNVVTRLHTPYFETLSIDKKNKKIAYGDKFICWLEKHSVKNSDFLTSSTECHRDFMAKSYSINSNAIQILPLGIHVVGAIAKSAERRNVLKVLYVSRLEHRKGTLTLFEAIPNVLKIFPNVEFTFIGKDRPHAPNGMFFKDYFNETFGELSNSVHFPGYVSNEDLQKYYLDCDIFVVPSVYESFGLIYIEAMAFGKPVIGCKAGGIPEVIDDGITGYLVPPWNSDLLASRITDLLQNDLLRKTMGENARKRVIEKFDRRVMTLATVDLYKAVVGSKVKNSYA